MVKLDYQKGQIRQYTGIGFPFQVKADSKTENSDLIPNNISYHNPEKNTGRKLKQYAQKKSGHMSGYVSRERGATIYPPNKNFVLEISVRR